MTTSVPSKSSRVVLDGPGQLDNGRIRGPGFADRSPDGPGKCSSRTFEDPSASDDDVGEGAMAKKKRSVLAHLPWARRVAKGLPMQQIW